jgi:hypothetical protein
MPLRESDIVQLATNRLSTRHTKGSEGSDDEGVDEGVSSIRSDTDDDSPVVDMSGNSEGSSSGNEGIEGGTAEGKSPGVDDVVWECRVLSEGGTAGLPCTVDCRP